MYHAGFELLTIESVPATAGAAVVLAYVNALVETNRIYLASYPHTPSLYAAGVRYRRQVLGSDRWIDIPRILQTRQGSCEDLVAYQVAWLQVLGGEPGAKVKVTWQDTTADGRPLQLGDGRPFTLYHITIAHSDGTEEDPSRTLGMDHVPFALP